ncbi:conjugative transposon protein TraM [Sphingobacterium siyangense]|uniref:conjugative transposon protein TraM n=1 Tax=Sphingobacterium siyangense TaxID=459529 RepID=UPI002FD99476
MENQANIIKKKRHRKFMLVLPLMALPFLTLMFWSMGGGRAEAIGETTVHPSGFNSSLPDAKIKEDGSMDKMSYYEQAKKDSAKFQELLKNDPNYQTPSPETGSYHYGDGAGNTAGQGDGRLNTSLYGGRSFNDPNSEKIYQKLAMLNGELSSPLPAQGSAEPYGRNAGQDSRQPIIANGDVDRLEQMMQMMGQPQGQDPEMMEINSMLEKIMDIQNPQRVQEKMQKDSQKKRGRVYAVSGRARENTISVLGEDKGGAESGFFSLEEDTSGEAGQNAIQAVIHENQTLVSGSTVKLRLTDEIMINGTVIPKDNFLFGVASLDGERLKVKITSIRYGSSLYPVELQAYDLDGLDGIYIPGAITRDVAKQSADRSLQTLGVASLDPSFGAQAAGAGIEAVKSLVSKKVKLVKVAVKSGYRLLLRDEKQKQDQSN